MVDMNTQRTTVLSLLYIFFLCFGATLFLKSCSPGNTTKSSYIVAYDSSWYPLEADGSLAEISAFSEDLIDEIEGSSGLRFTVIQGQWDQMPLRLKRGEYHALLSSLTPNNQNRRAYIFSEPYLYLGPVILGRKGSGIKSLDDLSKQRVAVARNRPRDLEYLRLADVRIAIYDDMQKAVEDLVTSKIDAIIMKGLRARTYEKGLYAGKVEVLSEPLNQDALRLVVLKRGAYEILIDVFNQNLGSLKESKRHQELVEKWDLDK